MRIVNFSLYFAHSFDSSVICQLPGRPVTDNFYSNLLGLTQLKLTIPGHHHTKTNEIPNHFTFAAKKDIY